VELGWDGMGWDRVEWSGVGRMQGNE